MCSLERAVIARLKSKLIAMNLLGKLKRVLASTTLFPTLNALVAKNK